MAVSKVILNGTTLIDVTNDTVAANNLLSGETATGADGEAVTGAYVAPTFTTQSKSINPSESAQTVTPDTGYDGLSQVSVGAISSTYVGSGIARKSSSDLTVSGASVSAPAGYYAAAASKSISLGSITAPTITVDSTTGEISASTKCNAAGYVALNTTRSSSEQLDTQAATTITPSTSEQTAVAAGKYTIGNVKVQGDANLIPENIADSVTIFGVTGTHQGGGSSENWSWMGRNPVKIQEWEENLSFRDIGVDQWTWSSSATTLRAATSLSPSIQLDLNNYDYVYTARVYTPYYYSVSQQSNLKAIPIKFANSAYFCISHNYSTLAAIDSSTPNLVYSGGSFGNAFCVDYYNSSGSRITYTSTPYGVYSQSISGPTYSSTSSLTPSAEFKTLAIFIRGGTGYLSSNALTYIDYDKSITHIKYELWRVDVGTADVSVIRDQAVYLHNNGMEESL